MHRHLTRQRTLRALPWALMESGTNILSSLIIVVVLGRLLVPADFGIFGIAYSISQILEILIASLFAESLIQRRDLDPRHVDTAVWSTLSCGLLAAGLCVGIGFFIDDLFEQPGLGITLQVLGLCPLLASASIVPQALLTRKLRMRTLAIRTVSAKAASIVLSIGGALLGWGAWSLVLGVLGLNFVTVAVLWTSQRRRPKLRFSQPHLNDLFAVGRLVALERLFWILTLRLFQVIVGYQHGAAVAGQFNMVGRAMDAIWNVLSAGSGRIALATFSSLQADREMLSKTFASATSLTTLISAPLFAGLAAVAPVALPLILGPKWEPAIPIFQLMCASAVINFPQIFVSPILLAVGFQKWNAINAGFALVITGIGLVLTADAPIWAIAAIYPVRQLFLMAVDYTLVQRALGLRPLEQIGLVIRPIGASAVMALCVLWIAKAMPAIGSSWGPFWGTPWITLASQIIVGAVITVVLALALNAPEAKRLIGLVVRRQP